jgi:hypothetical protein
MMLSKLLLSTSLLFLPLIILAQKVGIGTNTPNAFFHVNTPATGEGSVLFTGTLKNANQAPLPLNQLGPFMLWYPDKGAFRVSNFQNQIVESWLPQEIGYFSIAMGQFVKAKGDASIALGRGSWAEGNNSVALGGGYATDFNCFAMGYTASAVGYGSTAIGESVRAEGQYAFSLGAYARANGNSSFAMGDGVESNGYGSFAMGGGGSTANNTSSFALGYGNVSNGFGTVAVGVYNDPIITKEQGANADRPLFIVGNGTAENTRSNAFVVRANGRVGIGTNNPTYMLSIGDNTLGISRPVANTMAFYTLGFERMRISPTGLVGMGTNNPATDLEVRGSSDPTIRITHPSNGNPRLEFLRVGAGSFDWRIHNSGGLFLLSRSTDDLATVTDLYQFSDTRFRPVPDNALALGASNGRWSVVFAVNGTIQTSDARLKEQIIPISYGLDAVMQMNPVSFHWKDNPAGPANLGFLAQNMQKLVPETVHDPGNDGPLGMKYSELIPVLVKAIQELKQENDLYKARLEKLERKEGN